MSEAMAKHTLKIALVIASLSGQSMNIAVAQDTTLKTAPPSQLLLSKEWETARQEELARLKELNNYIVTQFGDPISSSAPAVVRLREAEKRLFNVEMKLYADNQDVFDAIRTERKAEAEYDKAFELQISLKTNTSEWAEAKKRANELNRRMQEAYRKKQALIGAAD